MCRHLVGTRLKVITALVLLQSLLLVSGVSANEKDAIKNAAQSEGVPEALLSAICYVESSHRSTIVRHRDGSSRSSVGLCQIQLRTARSVGYIGNGDDLLNPYINSLFAAKYLSRQLVRYGGDWIYAIAAYNRGSAKLAANGKPVNYEYVKKVFKALEEGR